MGEAAVTTNGTAGKTYTVADLKAHTTEKSCFLLLHGKVYDVTDFLDEHPGGYDIILNTTGRDATEDFEEIGHSNAAREMLDKYLLGDYEGGAAAATTDTAVKAKSTAASTASSLPADDGGTLSSIFKALLPVLIILVAAYFAFWNKK